jgi:hypothetical protein
MEIKGKTNLSAPQSESDRARERERERENGEKGNEGEDGDVSTAPTQRRQEEKNRTTGKWPFIQPFPLSLFRND